MDFGSMTIYINFLACTLYKKESTMPVSSLRYLLFNVQAVLSATVRSVNGNK